MNKLKKISSAIILSFALVSNVSAAKNTNDIKIEIDGKNVISDVAPFINNERTLVPIRVISENLGYNVNWDNNSRKVTVKNSDKTIELFIGKKNVSVNGVDNSIDVAPMIKNDRTFVPLRFISESFDNDVKWDNNTRTVKINRNKTSSSIIPDEVKSSNTNNNNKNMNSNVNSNNANNNKSSFVSTPTTNNYYMTPDPIAERKKVDAKLLMEIVDNLKFDEGFYDMNSNIFVGFGGTVQNNSPYVIKNIGREFKTKNGSVFFVSTTSSIPIGGISQTGAIGVYKSSLSEEDFHSLQCSNYSITIIMPDGSERLLMYNGITNQVE
ncbi:MAG: copper amine oxidase N-terminal domain-containing protein [Peptoniphilus harei]|nr:copper amine oxidase N-terminal domain-containing protein [Peptoniphilus harei]